MQVPPMPGQGAPSCSPPASVTLRTVSRVPEGTEPPGEGQTDNRQGKVLTGASSSETVGSARRREQARSQRVGESGGGGCQGGIRKR